MEAEDDIAQQSANHGSAQSLLSISVWLFFLFIFTFHFVLIFGSSEEWGGGGGEWCMEKGRFHLVRPSMRCAILLCVPLRKKATITSYCQTKQTQIERRSRRRRRRRRRSSSRRRSRRKGWIRETKKKRKKITSKSQRFFLLVSSFNNIVHISFILRFGCD